MLQKIIVILVVAAAFFFAVRRLVRIIKGRVGCGCSCEGCPHHCDCQGCSHNATLPNIDPDRL